MPCFKNWTAAYVLEERCYGIFLHVSVLFVLSIIIIPPHYHAWSKPMLKLCHIYTHVYTLFKRYVGDSSLFGVDSLEYIVHEDEALH